MLENVSGNAESEIPNDGCAADTSISDLNGIVTFHRKIEFKLESKSFNGVIGKGDFTLQTLNPSMNFSDSNKAVANLGPSSSVKKADGLEFSDNWLDSEFSFGKTIRRFGAGLQNLGNTCYLNSVLQCLTYTEPLAAYLQSGKHRTSCCTTGFCALCAIQEHVNCALQLTGKILAPDDLVLNLTYISSNFRRARQEDAHEYLVNLLESMHKCCLPKGVSSESPNAYEQSLVHRIFGGRLRSQVKCMQCSNCSNTFDPFLDLSLDIAKADSLHSAFINFTAAEQLDGGEKHYQCQRCKQKVKAYKQLSIFKAPYVLTIHLKRFNALISGEKIDKKVHFSLTMNLKPFVTGSYDGDLKYILYGVLVHIGSSTDSGHYYCFIRTASGTWYAVDDNEVFPVREKTVLEQKAYMLFYYRDRKNIVPKKPVHAKKDNMASTELRNEMLSASNQLLKGTVQNTIVDATDAGKGDIISTFLTKEDQLKEESSVQKNNEIMTLEKDDILELTSLSLLKDIAEEIAVRISKSEKCSSPLILTGKGSGFNANLGNKEGYFGNFSNVPITTTKSHENPDIENAVTDLTFKKAICVTESMGNDDKAVMKSDPVTYSNQSSDKKSQVEIIPNAIVTNVLLDKEATFTGLKLPVSDIVESSSSQIMSNGTLPKISIDQQPTNKTKKKVVKYPFANVHLGSNILYGASLSLKKKKHKRRKKKSLHLEDINLGPSTSEKPICPSSASVHSRKKKGKSSKGHNSKFHKTESKLVGEDSRDSVARCGVKARDKSTHKRSRSSSDLENQLDAKKSDLKNYNREESMQNVLKNTITRGVENTIVERWAEDDLPPSRDVESTALKTVSIGYVADEWDEEYDRGKRKKVKTAANVYTGPNLFQALVNKRKHSNKAKTDRSSSSSKPFRI